MKKLSVLFLLPTGLMTRFASIVCIASALAGCSSAAPPQKVADPPPGPEALHVIVSNQSFDDASIPIDVTIDGVEVITGEFDVGGQHTWVPFDFHVTAGKHHVHAESPNDVAVDADFDVDVETWGLLTYWYYEKQEGGTGPTARTLDWATRTEKPAFD